MHTLALSVVHSRAVSVNMMFFGTVSYKQFRYERDFRMFVLLILGSFIMAQLFARVSVGGFTNVPFTFRLEIHMANIVGLIVVRLPRDCFMSLTHGSVWSVSSSAEIG